MEPTTVSLAEAKARLSELTDLAALTHEARTADIQKWLRASRFADQFATGLRADDALHLAVAANHGARIRALDRTLVAAAEALGVSAELV